MSLSEKLQSAGIVTGLGLLIVFTVLICIIVIILIYPRILNLFLGKKSKPAKKEVQEETVEIVSEAVNDTDENELIAVLTAAVCCCLGKDKSNIVIKSYKRVNNSSWKRSGRNAQLGKY